MALKQIQQISIEVLGDGTSTTFSFSLSSYAGSTGSSTNTVVDYFWLGLTLAR